MRKWGIFLLFSLAAWADPIKFPIHEQIPGSKVFLDIYLTKVVPAKPRPAWCLKTSGLKPRDVMLTVLIREGESEQAVPPDAIKMLKGLALNPKALPAPGEVGDFGDRAVLGTEMVGALMVPSENLPGVPVTGSCLSLVPLFKTELDVADLAGPSRVMGALAHQVRYYPCPIWCDRDRASSFSPDDLKKMKEDPLFQSRLYQTNATFVRAQGVGVLTLTPTEAGKLVPIFEAHADQPHRLALRVDPSADAFLIWTQEDGLQAVNPYESKGSRMGAQHICLLPGQKNSQARLLGDGCVLFLTTADFKRLVQALKKHEPLTLPVDGDEMSKFKLAWRQTNYFDPISGQVAVAPEGWNTYQSGPKRTDKGPVNIEEIVLLTPDQEIARATTAQALGDFILKLEGVAKASLSQALPKSPQKLVIQCQLSPKGATYACAPSHPKLQFQLAKVPALKVEAPVKFQLILKIKPR